MSDKLSQLERLNKLLDEGRISESEYTDLKADVLRESDDQIAIPSTDDATEPQPIPTQTPMSADTPTIYKVALGAGIVSIFFGGTFGILAWATVALGIAALVSEKSPRRRWMAWTGLVLGVLFALVNVYLNGHFDSVLGVEGSPSEVATPTTTTPDLSLGFTLEEFPGRWNQPDFPPYVAGEPELGTAESWNSLGHPPTLTASELAGRVMFRYSMDGSSVMGLSGANDDRVWAIGFRSALVNLNAMELVAHLCATVAPAEIEACVKEYEINGGLTPYEGVTINNIPPIENEWEFGDMRWFLDYGGRRDPFLQVTALP